MSLLKELKAIHEAMSVLVQDKADQLVAKDTITTGDQKVLKFGAKQDLFSTESPSNSAFFKSSK